MKATMTTARTAKARYAPPGSLDMRRATHPSTQKKPKKAPKKKARHALPRQRSEKPFPFMELPPELRDMIYEKALVDANGICIAAKTKAYRRTVCRTLIYNPDECRPTRRLGTGRGKPRHVQNEESQDSSPPPIGSLVPNILAVSKQIHYEAVNILYDQDFMFRDPDALHRFLAIIGARNQQRIHSIEIRSFCTGRNTRTLNHCAFMSLATATNLKTLYLPNAAFRWYTNAKGLARGLYSNAHVFLEAYGAAHGRRDAALDIIQLGDDSFDWFYPGYRRYRTVAKTTTVEEDQAMFWAELRRLLSVR